MKANEIDMDAVRAYIENVRAGETTMSDAYDVIEHFGLRGLRDLNERDIALITDAMILAASHVGQGVRNIWLGFAGSDERKALASSIKGAGHRG